MKFTGTVLSFIYVSAIVAANLLVAHFGPWFSPINSLLLIGMDLSLRDKIHEMWYGKNIFFRMGVLIVVAGVVSFILNPATGMIAVASFSAFTAAMMIDTFVYQKLIKKSNLVKMNGSNASGAAVDSVVFPTVAFGSFLPEIVALQFAAKVTGGFLWSLVIEKFSKGRK